MLYMITVLSLSMPYDWLQAWSLFINSFVGVILDSYYLISRNNCLIILQIFNAEKLLTTCLPFWNFLAYILFYNSLAQTNIQSSKD